MLSAIYLNFNCKNVLYQQTERMHMMNRCIVKIVMSMVFSLLVLLPDSNAEQSNNQLQPYPENPFYLAWGETPVFPIGGAGIHSWYPLSGFDGVTYQDQLERLAVVVKSIDNPHVCGITRCLAYSPVAKGDYSGEALQPWLLLDDGRYDLTQFSPEWEKRLQHYLSIALENRIVISLEIWDDWSLTRGPGGARDPGPGLVWNIHPFNPKNNINYDETVLPANAERCNPPFYRTIPSQDDNPIVLDLQKLYVNRLLEFASDHPNVMINISNESRATLEWSQYWATYIREHAAPGLMIGDMPSTNRRDGHGECDPELNPLTLSTDPLYDYVDIAQGVSRHEFGAAVKQAIGGAERIRMYRAAMESADTRRPLVISKDYTNYGLDGDIVFWSRFVGGASTSRFHRPWGEEAETVVQYQHEAMERLGRFIAKVPFWNMAPAPEMLTRLPEGTNANVLAAPDGPVVIQLLGGGAGNTMLIDVGSGAWKILWVDPATGQDLAQSEVSTDNAMLELEIPGDLVHRILLLQR